MIYVHVWELAVEGANVMQSNGSNTEKKKQFRISIVVSWRRKNIAQSPGRTWDGVWVLGKTYQMTGESSAVVPRRCSVCPLDRPKRTKKLGCGMRKYKKVFKERGWQRISGIGRMFKKVDRSTGKRGVQEREVVKTRKKFIVSCMWGWMLKECS